jgi:hypothetical protein
MTQIESDRAQRHSGTQQGWSVEARASLEDYPLQIAEQVFTTKWKPVHFDPAKVGVPAGRLDFDEYLRFGLLSYPAAQALRWWFVAALDMEHKSSVETRLVRHEVKYERSARRIAEYAAINQFEENRSAANCRTEHA